MRQAEEHEALLIERINILDSWSKFEDALATLFGSASRNPDPLITSTIFFCIHSFRARQDMIEKLLNLMIEMGTADECVYYFWRLTMKNVSRQKSVRDLAAHGYLVTSSQNGNNHLTLSIQMGRIADMHNQYKKGHIGGLRSTDIAAATTRVKDRTQNIYRLDQLVNAYTQNDLERIKRHAEALTQSLPHKGS
ncbi:hypothetical protein FKB34_01955 [Glycocaulis profundi]|nr:hypothetical protein FKB34_01955 [Glycocaulis profundi]